MLPLKKDIDELIQFLSFLNAGVKHKNVKKVMKNFIDHREQLLDLGYENLYNFFSFSTNVNKSHIDKIIFIEAYLKTLLKSKPKTLKSFKGIHSKADKNEISSYIDTRWKSLFPSNSNFLFKSLRYIKSLFVYPLKSELETLNRFVKNQKHFLNIAINLNEDVLNQVKQVHRTLKNPLEQDVPLCLEICRFATKSNEERNEGKYSIQEYLERIDFLYKKRDRLIKKQFVNNIGEIAKSVMQKSEKDHTSLITTISSTLDALKNHETIDSGAAFLDDLKESLFQAFPIWVCRKQAVPFLFPCVEQSFDLVIVDEATQCGVDESLPLLYRAKKLIVVGDEKQTVLAKNSVIDDYLFHEFNLEEHLRNTQARGFKGGGSQIFSLVKGIKQAHVMLDEHYRCPPDIIQYSNHYVYHDELKTMQWVPQGHSKSVVVDYSERKARDTGRQTSGQFKGIETAMVDRFLKYVSKTIAQIEKEEGRRINVETDVALCYFLLKNEPYIKRVKGDLLTNLNRGDDILDGAGAALQGKERDYIFYFWDINRSNMMAFRQGDDPDKRKGELNVLMSRPKVRAYHFLHKNFSDLNHSTASITDFLWKTYNRQSSKIKSVDFKERKSRPEKGFVPWRRSSGQMMLDILSEMFGEDANLQHDFSKQFSVTVGEATHCVDLMISPENVVNASSVGLVDLCGFEGSYMSSSEIVDYYFQLQRATPNIKPIFLFMHELACEDSRAYKRLQRAIEKNVLPAKSSKKAS